MELLPFALFWMRNPLYQMGLTPFDILYGNPHLLSHLYRKKSWLNWMTRIFWIPWKGFNRFIWKSGLSLEHFKALVSPHLLNLIGSAQETGSLSIGQPKVSRSSVKGTLHYSTDHDYHHQSWLRHHMNPLHPRSTCWSLHSQRGSSGRRMGDI